MSSSSPFTIESKWFPENERRIAPTTQNPTSGKPQGGMRHLPNMRNDAVCVAAIQTVVTLVVLVCFRPSFVLTSRSDLELPRLSLPVLGACAAAAVGSTFLIVHFKIIR